MNSARTLELLQSPDASARIAGLRALTTTSVADGTVVTLLAEILQSADVDTRYATVQFLIKAAGEGRDLTPIIPLLHQLFTDQRFPSHLAKAQNGAFTVGAQAASAIALSHFRRGEVEALQMLATHSGWVGWTAIHALSAAKTAAELEPFLPWLQKMLAGADDEAENRAPARKKVVAGALLHAYWLKQEWDLMGELLYHRDEAVRLGALSALDDLVEGGEEIQPLLPTLLALFERPEADFAATRRAAARVLVWFKTKAKKGTKRLVLGSVDILQIPEVKAEIAELAKLVSAHRHDA
ncbi:MAG: hypothetical protein R3C14_38485 [Caldilineaceae bacterium]